MKQFSARRTRRVLLEALETRRLMTFSSVTPISDVAVTSGSSSTVSLAGHFHDSAQANTTVVMHFQPYNPASAGADVYVQLTDTVTPQTVANFLAYVNSGAFNNTIIHRSVPGFIIQGGGYLNDGSSLAHISTLSPVVNEFTQAQAAVGGGEVNVRGTIAMAKLDGDPDSATSEWFFNLADNASNLDNQNGGFTTFGTVTGSGMTDVVDTIATLPQTNLGGAFTNLPLAGNGQGNYTNLVTLTYVTAEATYQVTANTNPSLFSSVSIVGSQLKFNYAPGHTGTAAVTVTATDFTGHTATDTFDVTVTKPVTSVTSGGTALTDNQATPVNLGFPIQNATVSKTLRVTNTGNDVLTFGAPTVPAGFDITSPADLSTVSLNPGEFVDVTVSSTATTTTGAKSGTLVLNTNDPDTAAFDVKLTYTVAAHGITAVELVNSDNSTSALSGPVAYGAIDQNSPTPNSKKFRISNTGNATLTFSGVTEPAGFFVSDVQRNGVSIPGAVTYTASGRVVHIPALAVGDDPIDIVVTQRADTGGDKSGTLYLVTSDLNNPAYGIALTGFTHYKKLAVSYGGSGLVADPTTHVTSSVDLGSGAEGTSFLVTFHVTNTGDTLDLSLGSPTLPAGFSVVTALPASLAAGASADLVLAVDTSSPGTRSGTIIFNSGDPLYALSSPGFRVPVTAVVNYRRLAVTDASGAAVASSSSVSFGTVLQGDVARVTYHLANTGNLPLTLSNPTLPAGYSLVGAFPTSIAAGGSADVVLSLDTLGRGTYSGAFTFNTDDANHPTFVVNLSGKVIAKGIVVSLDGETIPYGQASTVDFGNVRQGTTGTQVTFTVSNSGLLPLTFQTASIPAGYSIVQALPDSLAPGASAQFTVALDTSESGYYAGTLHIVSSDPDRPSFDVPLSAAVTMPVKLGAGGASSVTFTDADGTMSTVTLTGPGSAVLDFLGNNLVTTGSNKKGITVAGSSVALGGVTLAGTSVRGTTLEIVSKGGHVKTVDIGDVSGSALRSLEAPAGRLVGDVAIKVGTLSVAAADGATLELGAGAVVEIPVVTNTTLTTGKLKSLTVNKWIGGSITAKAIDSLTVNGNINTSLTVRKALGNATINGNLAGGTWTLGSVTKLDVARKVTSAWTGKVTGSAANIVVGRNFGGSITAKVLGMTVNGSVAGATVAAKSLSLLSVKGSLANTSVAARAVSKVLVGRIKTHNGGTPFGLTARSIGSLEAGLDTGKTVRLTGVSNVATLNSQLKAQKLGAMNDLKIQIGQGVKAAFSA